MKKVLSVMAVAAMLLFSSCDPSVSLTPITDVLQSAKKGWVMTSVKSVPAYQLESGAALEELFADGDYEHNTGFFKVAEKDDAIIFGEDGVETIDPGTVLPEDGSAYQTAVTTSYSVNELTEQIYLQIPFEYDELVEVCTVKSYNKKELVLQYVRKEIEDDAKSQNTWTITLVPVK